MSVSEEPAEPQGIRSWSATWRAAYATAVTAAFLAVLVGDVVIVTALATGTVTAGLGTRLMLLIGFPILSVVAGWLFWTFGVKNIADLVTDGRFARTRTERFRRWDARFSASALIALLLVPLLPFLQFFDS